MLMESLMELAALAGNTIVVAATTDAWEEARRKFARLFGHGDPNRTQAAARRLEETHQQLTAGSGADLEPVRSALEAQWVTRLADLLEEDPSVEADLRALVEGIQAQLPARVVAVADHSFAAEGPVTFTASGSAVAAGVIHGDATTETLRGRIRRAGSRTRSNEYRRRVGRWLGRGDRRANRPGRCSPPSGAHVAAAPASATGSAAGLPGWP